MTSSVNHCLISMQLTKGTGMHLPQLWESSKNNCIYVHNHNCKPNTVYISIAVAMTGKIYQCRLNCKETHRSCWFGIFFLAIWRKLTLKNYYVLNNYFFLVYEKFTYFTQFTPLIQTISYNYCMTSSGARTVACVRWYSGVTWSLSLWV